MNAKENNINVTKVIFGIIKSIIAIGTFFLAGYLQAAFLRADLQYVYIGKSIVVWVFFWCMTYQAFVRTLFIALGFYRW